jgi:hypothetical protein
MQEETWDDEYYDEEEDDDDPIWFDGHEGVTGNFTKTFKVRFKFNKCFFKVCLYM